METYKVKVRQHNGMNQDFTLRDPAKIKRWKVLAYNFPWNEKSKQGIRLVKV